MAEQEIEQPAANSGEQESNRASTADSGDESSSDDEQGSSSSDDSPYPVDITQVEWVANSQIDFTVTLSNGEETVLSEREVQLVNPNLVYACWDTLGGRDQATGYNKYHVLRILDHAIRTDGRLIYEVQWVGYRSRESTWEKARLLRSICSDLKDEYDQENDL
ncbi:hypothetical protein ACHAP5_010477 [Fusarium lateritium]